MIVNQLDEYKFISNLYLQALDLPLLCLAEQTRVALIHSQTELTNFERNR